MLKALAIALLAFMAVPAALASHGGPVDSPYVQLRQGAEAEDISCRDGYDLLIRGSSAACATPETARAMQAAGLGTISVQRAHEESTQKSGAVGIGGLYALTGQLGSQGKANAAAAGLAAGDFNSYLAESGQAWSIRLEIRDYASDPDVALREIIDLERQGIKILTGGLSSAAITGAKDYMEQNAMAVIACCSSAPSLAVKNDGIFRLAPDDRAQAGALAAVMDHAGVEALVPVWRNDAWGSQYHDALSGSAAALGIEVHEGIPYEPGQDMAAVISELAVAVSGTSGSSVGVAMISFDEGIEALNAAKAEGIDGAQWFATSLAADDPAYTADMGAASFAEDAGLLALSLPSGPGPGSGRVREAVMEATGSEPTPYAYMAYDAVTVIGRAIEAADSAGPYGVMAAVAGAASAPGYEGTSGKIVLNAAGDRAGSSYEIWSISGGQWRMVGSYDGQSGVSIGKYAYSSR